MNSYLFIDNYVLVGAPCKSDRRCVEVFRPLIQLSQLLIPLQDLGHIVPHHRHDIIDLENEQKPEYEIFRS